MIGWRVGWVVAPARARDDARAACTSTTALVASGFAQIGARCGAREPATATSARRRRVAAPPRRDARAARRAARRRPRGAGRCCSTPPRSASTAPSCRERLLEQKVAATPMRGWGGDGRRPARAVRLQQRAGRAAGAARRAVARSARVTRAGHLSIRSGRLVSAEDPGAAPARPAATARVARGSRPPHAHDDGSLPVASRATASPPSGRAQCRDPTTRVSAADPLITSAGPTPCRMDPNGGPCCRMAACRLDADECLERGLARDRIEGGIRLRQLAAALRLIAWRRCSIASAVRP